MGKLVTGDVVVVPFPFSDLSNLKRRPALVVAGLEGDDVILCMITSQAVSDVHSIPLEPVHFANGGLPVASNIRPTRLFTAESSLIMRVAGHLTPNALERVLQALQKLFTPPT